MTLSGDLSERTLTTIAQQAQDAIEQVPGVLSATLQGTRDEVVEIIAEPMLLKSYGVSLDQFVGAAAAGNSLVAAGALEGPQGRFAVKVPALIETPEDVLNIPVAASNAASVTLGDVATIKPTFRDATSVTRVNGRPAIAIEVAKRAGANLIDTVDGVKKAIAAAQKQWPDTLKVEFLQDQSTFIIDMLDELQNSVITAVFLVAVIILFFLGGRASIFIGIAVPFSFLVGILGLGLAGLTVNIVVLFSLILAVGMLVDDAIIVSEFAERRMSEGMQPREAYAFAAHRMSGPVIAATLTRIAAFSPAAPVAGHRRPVHGLPADDADRDAVVLAGGGADLHADARRADRQDAHRASRRGAARRPAISRPCAWRCAIRASPSCSPSPC